MEQAELTGMSLVRQSLGDYELSSAAKDILMASWRTGTANQYQTYLKRWQTYCRVNNFDVFQPGLNRAIEFLVSLYDLGLSYSAINTARSALSSILILKEGGKFGEHPLVCRYMKGVFELRPALPKYTEIWDVNIVLDYLKSFQTLKELTLKDLTLKVTMLLCLTTGQRGQTIHMLDVNYIQELPNRYRITIKDKLKTTKPGKHLKPIDLLSFQEDKRICVVDHLREYLDRTKSYRKGHTQLLLSFLKPYKPVCKSTIARWIKQILKSAGIDVDKYTAHSSRAASTSKCKTKGLNIAEIMKSAGWSKESTFSRFYEKPVDNNGDNFGTTILTQ